MCNRTSRSHPDTGPHGSRNLLASLLGTALGLVCLSAVQAQTISIQPSGPTRVVEGGTLSLAIQLDDPGERLSRPATLRFVAGGTVTSQVDYIIQTNLSPQIAGVTFIPAWASGEVTFDPSLAGTSTTVYATVELADDTEPEHEETLFFTATVSGGATLAGGSKVVFTVLDNDNPEGLPLVSFDLPRPPPSHPDRSQRRSSRRQGRPRPSVDTDHQGGHRGQASRVPLRHALVHTRYHRSVCRDARTAPFEPRPTTT